MIEGFIAAIASSVETLTSRKILAKGESHSESFVISMFMGIIILMAPLAPWFFFIDIAQMSFKYIISFFFLIAFALTYNILYFKSLKRVHIDHAQPIILSSWIFTIIFGFLFFPSERNVFDFVFAAIATICLLISETRGKRIILDHYEKLLICAAFFIGLYNMFSKIVLEVTNPFTLYWVRTLIMLPFFIVLTNMFMKRKGIHFQKKWSILVVSFASILTQVATFWAYQNLGLVMTSLLMTLTPVVSLWGAKIFLKEDVDKRFVLTTVIIIGCIVGSLLL